MLNRPGLRARRPVARRPVARRPVTHARGPRRVEDTHAAACDALARQSSLDPRSRFVRERGIAEAALVLVAQFLDEACSEGAASALVPTPEMFGA